GAAVGLDAQLARNEIEFVIDDDEIGGRQLVEAHGLADGLAGKVHEGLRLDQQHLLAVNHAIGNLGLKLLLPVGKAMAAEYFIRRHETDIMPVMHIFGARIAKTCDEQHGSEPLYSAPMRKAIIRRPWLLLLQRLQRLLPTSGRQEPRWWRW